MKSFLLRPVHLVAVFLSLLALAFAHTTSTQAQPVAQATPTATAMPEHDHAHMSSTETTTATSPQVYAPIASGATTSDPDMTMAMEPVAPDWVTTCPSTTVPFETQAWWMEDFGHIHVGFCAPFGQKISGNYTFKVRLILHGNPGTLTMLQAQIDSSSYGGQTAKVNVTCPKTDTCGWDREVTARTNEFPNDGWHTMRIRGVVREPDGKELVATTFIPVYLNNGKPVQNHPDADISDRTSDRYDYVAGRGWYTERNYIWSVIFAPPYANKTVNGTWAVRMRPMATTNPLPISRFIVKLDATHSAAGTVAYDSTENSTKAVNLNIDTKKLGNGWHSLLARTESANQPNTNCSGCSGKPQTQAGVTKIWFNVKN